MMTWSDSGQLPKFLHDLLPDVKAEDSLNFPVTTARDDQLSPGLTPRLLYFSPYPFLDFCSVRPSKIMEAVQPTNEYPIGHSPYIRERRVLRRLVFPVEGMNGIIKDKGGLEMTHAA